MQVRVVINNVTAGTTNYTNKDLYHDWAMSGIFSSGSTGTKNYNFTSASNTTNLTDHIWKTLTSGQTMNINGVYDSSTNTRSTITNTLSRGSRFDVNTGATLNVSNVKFLNPRQHSVAAPSMMFYVNGGTANLDNVEINGFNSSYAITVNNTGSNFNYTNSYMTNGTGSYGLYIHGHTGDMTGNTFYNNRYSSSNILVDTASTVIDNFNRVQKYRNIFDSMYLEYLK